MMTQFKFGKPYKKIIFITSGERFERYQQTSLEMYQQLVEQRQRWRDEAEAREREAIERGFIIHQEEFNRLQSEYVQRYVDERHEGLNRRYEEVKRKHYGI